MADLSHPDLPALCDHLRSRRVEFLVIGGWAAIAHGLVRTTMDVDLFVKPTRANIDTLVSALSEVGFGIAGELDPAAILDRHVFLFADQIRVDLFTKPWGLSDFEACWARRREFQLGGVVIPFIGFDDLIRSKETGREQDEADVHALREIERLRRGS